MANIRKELPGFQLSDGTYAQHPATKELAELLRVCAYQPHPPEICERCGLRKIIFVKTGISRCCAQEDSILAYNEALKAREPLTAMDALSRGLDYYWASPHKGTYCGHPDKRTLSGGCYFCSQMKASQPLSPRQAALSAGEVWYTPLTPCSRCGKTAERRVANGECRGCSAKHSPEAKVEPIHRQWPDMIISRDDAKAAGMKTYRTGKACKYGHEGWRWVSTRGCLTCQGRD